MRVGIITFDYLPINGGVAQYVGALKNALGSFPNTTVIIFSPCGGKDKNDICLFPELRRSSFGHFLFSYRIRKVLPSLVAEYKLDIVHAMSYPSGGIFIFPRLPCKTVLTIHGTYYQSLAYRLRNQWKRLFMFFEKISYKSADKCICVSQSIQGMLLKYYRVSYDKTFVIPTGFDNQLFYQNQAVVTVKNMIFFTGFFSYQKGIFILLKSIRYLTKEMGVSVDLFMAGDGPLLIDIKKSIKRYGIESCVHLLGWLSGEELSGWYQKAEIFVMPSLFEGMPIAALEAMACGLPIVGSRCMGLVDIIQDGINGFLVPRGDYKMLAQRIALLLTSPVLRKKFSTYNAQLMRELHTWNIIADHTWNFYHTLIDN